MEVKSSGPTSHGDVTFEQLMDEFDKKQSAAIEESESPYDTESEIKVIKRFQPTQIDDEDQIIILGAERNDMDQRMDEPADSDLHSMPDDEVVSISGFGTDDSNEEGAECTETKVSLTQSEEATVDNLIDELTDLNTFAAKQSDPIGHLCKEIISLTAQLESSITQKVTEKLEESVPDLIAESLKATLPNLISESLKLAIPEIIAESVKQTRVDQTSVHVRDMATLMGDLVLLLDSASVFAKANAEGRKWEKANSDTQNPDPTQGEK
ncbi:hypothetical protein Tco_1506707 [Tanacetum coccineum]